MSLYSLVRAEHLGDVYLDTLPHDCPFCHRSITPRPITSIVNKKQIEVFFACPNKSCLKSFIGYYQYNGVGGANSFTGQVSKGNLISRLFSEVITTSFVDFVTIYHEAQCAEQQSLLEICGVGYRKALEFLIKDYAISKHPTKQEAIEKAMLAKVISDYVSDANIKSVSKRAAWLGNDETHYVKKWVGKNLNDLKKLIDLTVHWIEMEKLTASFEEDMPD